MRAMGITPLLTVQRRWRMPRCEIPLVDEGISAYRLRRNNVAPSRAVCFLRRFLPKLGGAAGTAIFLLGVSVAGGPECDNREHGQTHFARRVAQ
jgi:hypothetical protein